MNAFLADFFLFLFSANALPTMQSFTRTMANTFRQLCVLLSVALFAVARYVIVLFPPLKRRVQQKMDSTLADTPFKSSDFKQSILG